MATSTVRHSIATPLDALPALRLPYGENHPVYDSGQVDQIEEHGFKLLLAGLGALPLVSYLTLLLFAGYAAQVTGHWPAYANPNPRSLSGTATTLIEL